MNILKIALVEDEKDLAEAFIEFFSSENIFIQHFKSGTDLLVSKEIFDVYFIDYRMPKMNGDELAWQLPDKPKYLITGELDLEEITFKFKDIIGKPYAINKIHSILNQELTSL